MKKTCRILAIILALTMLLSVSAFAAWDSFQGGSTNNGVVTSAPISEPNVTEVALPNNGAFTGVDAESVISNGVAYTLYNGGAPSGTNGGARLHATDLSDGSEKWNIQLNSSAKNVSQLSTPYLDGSTLYAATTYYADLIDESEFWKVDGVSAYPIVIGTGTHTLQYTGLDLPASFSSMQLNTGIDAPYGQVTATVTLSYGSATYSLGESKSWGGTLYLYNTDGTVVPAGNDYTITISITNNSGADLQTDYISFDVPHWFLYKLSVSSKPGNNPAPVTSGYGQANSPIGHDSEYIYWGIYDGDSGYYQMPKNSEDPNAILHYNCGDVYNAGAAVVTIDGTDYSVFGSDTGKIYVRPTGDFESGSGNIITLARTDYPTGAIRSTVVVWNNSVYFTSKGGEYQGNTASLVWKIPVSELLTATTIGNSYSAIVKFSESSTSTPVISGNGILYVGTNSGFTSGTIKAFNAATLTPYDGYVYEGDPVQSSPIVYSEDRDDYIFFTTNNERGTGYCYYVNTVDITDISEEWAVETSNYALHGFSADAGYMVFGNDSNKLYIISE